MVQSADQYRRQVKNFLADGTLKVLKTKEGDMWSIGVNGTVQENHERFPGAIPLSFEWTEIAVPPEYGIVVMRND